MRLNPASRAVLTAGLLLAPAAIVVPLTTGPAAAGQFEICNTRQGGTVAAKLSPGDRCPGTGDAVSGSFSNVKAVNYTAGSGARNEICVYAQVLINGVWTNKSNCANNGDDAGIDFTPGGGAGCKQVRNLYIKNTGSVTIEAKAIISDCT